MYSVYFSNTEEKILEIIINVFMLLVIVGNNS